MKSRVQLLAGFILFVAACSTKNAETDRSNLRFKLLSKEECGIDFVNKLDYTEELNTYTFRNFYNGGGVGIGDFNLDGLQDIFFSGNLTSNKLYLNKGNLTFEDISEKAGVSPKGVWTTGVSIADVNADGYPDIYICKSGPPDTPNRFNQLFINNKDLTFTDRAKEFGLDFKGLSTHAAFFDYDKDGDLDCYLLNNSIRSVGNYDLRKDQRSIPDTLGGNKLLRNDGDQFVDVSQKAGIYTSQIGFGLGVTIGDLNKDSWPDIYVSNDFFEKDYLYFNNGDGTFTESIDDYMQEISMGSMGADMADINNDGLPEIFVTEMLPESDARLKTTSQFESWDKYLMNLENGYHHQFSRNVLQLNNGDGTFSEISRFAGVHATDWSWGALIFDMDNDGLKDIFVANGIYKDLLDQDYVNFIGNPEMVREILRKERRVMKRLVDSIPSNPIQNYLFKNNGDLTFSNVAQSSGLDHATFSNGSAYADLDNDGDLDLVLSNVNMPSFVYENRSNILAPNSKSITVQLEGQGRNTSGIGSKITVFAGSQRYYQEINPMRGFMSSIDTRALFGVGNVSKIDSLVVEWPDDRKSVLKDVAVAQVVKVRQSESVKSPKATLEQERKSLFKKLNTGIGFLHRENPYVDFDRDPLLFTMSSNEGPCLCVGDINNDRLDDFYVGGAKGQAGSLFIQQRAGTFTKVSQEVFDGDKESEDTDCVIFDADNDGQNDLYVASGGTEFSSSSPALASRLYFNRGKGRFQKSSQLLPIVERFESTSTVSAADFDNDGDQDLFVGARVVPLLYGVPANGYLLTNDGKGKFRNETASLAPAMKEMGMITASRWIDVNNDRYLDLLVVGDWMGITLFLNRQGKLELQRNTFGDTEGWYRALEVADLNGDGFTDFVTGNHGLNSRFRASKDEPVQLYVNDFDRNGSVEHILTRYSDGKSLPMVLRNDLVKQIPSLRKKYLHYRNYKEQGINDIFSKEQLEHAVILHASDFQSSAWINKKDGTFEKIPLPGLAQITPIYAIAVNDFDGDKIPDILLGGNQTRSKPEAGIYQASYGLLLKGDGNGKFAVLSHQESGVVIHGEMREARAIQLKGEPAIIVARNNDSIEVLIKK